MNQTLVIAISILLGSVIIAGAVILKDSPQQKTETAEKIGNSKEINATPEELKRKENRILYGNVDAPITIVEFSDLECTFCARLSPDLKKIVDESEGKIVWEYRHLPLPIHSNALNGAIASECVARELGSEAFWQFSEKAFENVRALSNDFFTKTALDLGVNKNTYSACISSEEVKKVVADDMLQASKLDVQGTPYSIIIDSKGKLTAVEGAQPLEYWQNVLTGLN